MEPLLSVKDLVIEFNTDKGVVRAIDRISFELNEGETVGIVGESGCGKSVTSLSIMQLIPSPPGRIVSGEIRFRGDNLLDKSEAEMRKIRGNDISMIFQEPMTALNPVFTIGNQLTEVIRQHQRVSTKKARSIAIDMLTTVGIPVPERRIDEFPHQLSGGMRQRVMIAMALSCKPSILIADEPTTALDVTIQAQVMDEISALQKTLNMGMLLITHDMGVIAETCEKVIVMYCGSIIEVADVKSLFANPQHPYTEGLLNSIPSIREHKLKVLPTIEGKVPDLLDLPSGCRFADRCYKQKSRCHEAIPKLTDTHVACFDPNCS